MTFLTTIAFNNPRMIELQATWIPRNVADSHVWTVADNSSRRRCRRAIRAICRTHGVCYLPLPANPYTRRDPSRSHAEALNFVARRWANRPGSPVVGFLDHDVFPVRRSHICEGVGSAIAYGREQQRGEVWYLWPGLLFLRADRIDLSSLDFHPWAGGDTGAGLAQAIYAHHERDRIRVMREETDLIDAEGDDRYQQLDDWVHTENGSYWREAPSKDERVMGLLERLSRSEP
jgi:hypothetical protein